jgi:hypothetical protein
MTGGNRSTRRKLCPSATLSVTNPTWVCLVFNLRNRGEGPATNRPKYGTAFMTQYSTCKTIYLHTHDTFNDVISMLSYDLSNGGIIRYLRIGKDVKGSGRGVI